jgi:CRISPR/Cas system CSM-associated protein Csm2 small subunit
MKKVTLFFAVLVILTACTMQRKLVSFADEPFVQVYENLGATQDELYTKANDWMISAFNNAESVIQHQDKEEGVIMGKYLMRGSISRSAYGTTIDSRVFAKIDVRVKDNKARIEIVPQDYWHGTLSNAYTKEKAMADMEQLAESFQNNLSKETIDF